MTSPKYPRTCHWDFSPGCTNDDRILPYGVQPFLDRELVATEKLDGSNVSLERDAVYARSHGGAPKHPSFDMLKAFHASVRHCLQPGLQYFGEWCYAVHSITYTELPAALFVFGIRDIESGVWWDFDCMRQELEPIGILSPPVVWRGTFVTRASLQRAVLNTATLQSTFGGVREGVVVRTTAGFHDSEFDQRLAKWVRANHVQTDDHWSSQTIVRQNVKSR